ncbi:lipid-binding SYLF domain-containing protein [Cloacibacillus porcorum]|uniref:lipid-binding SYLF domain-containing protein n=1 Tax=Cloacibacillus porcorum TaxID=1197717 RepID=UPI002357CC4C|nr:lipid-binding SYLF domain-containing protein [Cloacibacillus porcorum]MCI5865068.1 lipid-binding SYLF domain-containing protein [Cloacibacillus porcorum]MDD7648424.1 lipid-binding SYLF domain-containing protein [Cloacibacillus porcorum]MDY4094473.1 lipid-binding SYLF domain-containing protein [Cloacibacillus porcorum]
MKVSRKITIFALIALLVAGAAQAAFAETAHMRRIRLSTDLINKMAKEQDADALADVIKSGKGVAIFPAVTKAGLGIGGQTGEGVVFLRQSNGRWTGPAFMGISGASIGFQIGVQSVGLVLVITNEQGLRAFTGGNSFKLGADVAIAAGPVGRDTSAATDGRAKASIYSYSMSKGLFAGISIDGSVINQNRDANKAYWGRDISAANALKKPATDKRVTPLIKALNNLVKKAPK